MKYRAFLRHVLVFLGIMVFAGCTSSQPTSLYVLTPSSAGESTNSASQSAACPSIAIGPVSMPEYLDRSEIVTRVGPNRLGLSELHHWAEPLRENLVRVLADNLNSGLCGGAVAATRGRGEIPGDYRLRVDVRRFEPLERERALLAASWTFRDPDSGRILATRRAVYETPVKGTDHQAVAAAMSNALASLSRDIIDTFLEVSGYSPD